MHTEYIFRIIFFAIFFALLGVRIYFNRKLQHGGDSSWKVEDEAVQREVKVSILLRLALFIFMLAAALIYALSPTWLEPLAIPLPDWLRWFGVGLALVGLALLVWVHATLGRQWSTNLQLGQEHQLVTSGPYHRVRHPMYTALFASFIGLGLIAANWLWAPLVFVSIPVLAARIGREEQMLVEQFGQEYLDYMRRTGRFLPRLS